MDLYFLIWKKSRPITESDTGSEPDVWKTQNAFVLARVPVGENGMTKCQEPGEYDPESRSLGSIFLVCWSQEIQRAKDDTAFFFLT